jgi:four helix bundle protein
MARIQGDLKERTIAFAERVLNIADGFPNNNKGWVVGRQFIRCGTSVGANVHEADHALSDADFSFKCSTARKEASEVSYWLELCRRTNLLKSDDLVPLANEANEIMRILSSIVMRTEAHRARRQH